MMQRASFPPMMDAPALWTTIYWDMQCISQVNDLARSWSDANPLKICTSIKNTKIEKKSRKKLPEIQN